MRILYSHRIGTRDGQGVHIEELVTAFRQLGHEVCIVGPSVYERAEFGNDSRLVLRIRRMLPRAASELAELAYSAVAALRLWRSARAFAPDVVYERHNLFFLAGMLVARHLRVPYCVEVNAPLADERERFAGLSLKRLAHGLEHAVWRSADRVLTVTSVLKNIVAAAGVPPGRIEVVQNATDVSVFANIGLAEVGEGPIVLGFVGFMRDWHGLDHVVREIANYRGRPPVQLVIVGEGPAKDALRQQAAALGIADRVRFPGLVDRAAIPRVISGFDIALQPRAVGYASPLKLFEYMAAGRAIVAPDQPNIREVLTHGRDALLFDPTCEGAMWASIASLIADATLRSRLGSGARNTLAQGDFTWLGNARRITAWLQEDLAAKRRLAR
jgi:glycosyltransferase involved in cell wall biosynthesis